MDALEAIIGRRVQRAFAARAVETDKLRKIVDAGRHAMSARNLEPRRFIVVQNRDTLRDLGALCTTGRFVADAPAAVVILKDLGNARWADIDCAQAAQNMATAAWSLDLGTCWVGNFDAPKIAQLLGAPDGWAVFMILPFGYHDPANPPKSQRLKPRSEAVSFERWGQPAPS
jgi:nitroreductase